MTSYVYVLGDDAGPWKVGCSDNPEERRKAILYGYPGEHFASRKAQIRYLVKFDRRGAALDAEASAHRLLDGQRVPWPGWGGTWTLRNKRIEWFEAPLETVCAAVNLASNRESRRRDQGE